MVNTKKIKVGIIGFGRMGNKYLTQLLKNGRYDVTYICDVCEEARQYAAKQVPQATIVADEDLVFNHPTVQAAAPCPLAN